MNMYEFEMKVESCDLWETCAFFKKEHCVNS